MDYIDMKYKPTHDDLVCRFYVEPNRISIEKAAEAIASESSIGTWTDLATMNKKIAEKLRPRVYQIDGKTVYIAYPQELFEKTNISQILASVAGNIFGMKVVNNLRLEDIHFPKSVVKSFKGPRFGIEGVRRVMNVKKRPLLGTIIKPKVGLDPLNHAKVAYQAWVGGCDLVKDDENLTSMVFNNFEDRIRYTLDARDKAESQTGERKEYMPNISSETVEMTRRAEIVKAYGGKYVMIDIVTVGWSALDSLRRMDPDMIIHAHRAGHAAFTRNPKHGISMLVFAKAARLIGVDQLHIGTIVGKMEGRAEEVEAIESEMEHSFIRKDKSGHVLEQSWYDLKPIFPVCSGGLHPGLIPELIKLMGTNIIIQVGGGIHGHPDGTVAGAVAARQSITAAIGGIPLKRYAASHTELNKAWERWG